MNSPEKTQDPQTEQLLKLLDMQVAAARERRMARESGRSRVGVVGIVVVAVVAAVSLSLLLMILEQMRPDSGNAANNVPAESR